MLNKAAGSVKWPPARRRHGLITHNDVPGPQLPRKNRLDGRHRISQPGRHAPDRNYVEIGPGDMPTTFASSTRNEFIVARSALLVLSAVSLRNGEHELGIQHAADALSAEPFDETACRALMRAHAVAGNRAEALRVYANCRKLFREELGAEPSEQTAAVFLSILRTE
jgi:hypothetical protein